MKLAYEALDGRGDTRSDVLEAASREEAMEMLRRQGMFLTKLSPIDEEGSPDAVTRKSALTRAVLKRAGSRQKHLVLFTRQMSMLMGVGTGVVPALKALAKQADDERWASVLQRIHDEVEQGAPLAQALGREPEFFSQVFCSMVAAGEATAMLPRMFSRLSDMAKQQWEVRSRVIGATVYPLVLMTMCLAVTAVLLFFVLPRFTVLFETLKVELPASTAQLMALSGFLTSQWMYLLGGAGVLTVAATVYVRSDTGREGIGWAVIRLPAVGSLVRSLIMARLCRLLGLMIQARVPLLESVELTLASIRHKEFREVLNRTHDVVVEGHSLASGLEGSPLVPPMVYQAVAAGEDTGNVGEALLFLADWMDEENKQRVASLSKAFEPVMLVFMGLVVGGAAVSLFMPLFDMATAAAG